MAPRLFNRGVVVLALGFFTTFSLPGAASPSSTSPVNCGIELLSARYPRENIVVSRFVDGDTVHLNDGRKVRLIGINTPELHTVTTPEPFAEEAQRMLGTLLEGRQAVMVVGRDSRDNHGRTLAHLFDLRGRSIEMQLLASGMGWHIAIPPNLALADCLSSAEQQARSRHQGVWSRGATAVKAIGKGGFYRVSGRVTKITFARNWWISLENHLVALIKPQDQQYFDKADLAALKGRNIELKGWVYPGNAKKYEPWRMNLNTPFGLTTP